MKKRILKLVPIILLVGIVFILWCKSLGYEYDENIILDNQEAYTTIANICYENAVANGLHDIGESEAYYYFINAEKKRISCHDCSGNIISISLDATQMESLNVVLSTFELYRRPLDVIAVYDTFVVFRIDIGLATFIYSVNDEEPKYLNQPNEGDKDIYIDKITDNWYFAYDKEW